MPDMFKLMPLPNEPKRNNRFVVEFPKEFDIESFVIQSITKPKWNNGKWDNIEIAMLDLIDPSTSHRVMKLIDLKNKIKTGFFSKRKNLFSLYLKSLDPTGAEIEEWVIDVQDLIYVDFGNLNYGNDGIPSIKLVLKVSNCKLKGQEEDILPFNAVICKK